MEGYDVQDGIGTPCLLCETESAEERFMIARRVDHGEYKIISGVLCGGCAREHSEGRGWSAYMAVGQGPGAEHRLSEEAQTMIALLEDSS